MNPSLPETCAIIPSSATTVVLAGEPFLGVLLTSDSSNNDGHWASTAFDQAITDALGSRDSATAQAAYERAMAEIQREVPLVPLFVGTQSALSRDGLLGAGDNGLGILRMGSMAWAE